MPESERWQKARDAAVLAGGKPASPLAEIMGGPLLGRTLVGIALTSVALIGTWGSVQWIPLWADKMTAGTVEGAKATAHTLSALGATFGSLLAPILLGKMRRRWSYCVLCLVSLAVCAALFRTQTEYNTLFLVLVCLTGATTAAFYGWFPLYLPELFPTRVRATGQGVCFNAGRLVAAVGALTSGQLVAHYGGYPQMGAVVTLVYLAGLALVWLAPETRGRPLPE